MTPFFSIGVTTYDREEMLKEALGSILDQTFSDYEVIVSNDNPERKISGQSVGICDPRFKFVNQSTNLGEFSNLNYLWQVSTGKYITWINDDDLYLPEFLESAYQVLLKYSLPKCLFTFWASFKDELPKLDKQARKNQDELFTGPEFFYRYCKGKAETLSHMGLFDRNTIQAMGGLEDISGDGKGMLFEEMLLARSIAFDKIAYINKPLALKRLHEGSWEYTNTDLGMYRRAADNLSRQCIEIFKSPGLKNYFYTYLYYILNQSIDSNLGVMLRQGDKSVKKIIAYFIYARRYINSLKASRLYLIGLIVLIHVEINIILCFMGRMIGKRLNKIYEYYN